MSDVILKDHSIHEPSTAHQHPLETIPQGSQADGVLQGHDHRDVDTSILGKSLIGLILLIVFSFVVTWFFTHGILNSLAARDSVPSASFSQRDDLESAWPVAPVDTQLQPPSETPALWPEPEKPMIVLREKQEEALSSYNWTQDEQGRRTGVSIPIDRAIELTLERGLPSDGRAQPTIEKPTGDIVAIGSIRPSEKFLKQEVLKQKQGGGSENHQGTAAH